MLGCSVFVARLVVLPERRADPETSRFDDSAKAAAIEIGGAVATDHGLSLVSGSYARLGGEDYATIAVFQHRGKVWLSVLIKDDRSEIAFVITDQANAEETKMTAGIRHDLMREVGVRLPGTEVRYEERTERGSLMGP